jgi:hypothetical protein
LKPIEFVAKVWGKITSWLSGGDSTNPTVSTTLVDEIGLVEFLFIPVTNLKKEFFGTFQIRITIISTIKRSICGIRILQPREGDLHEE